MATVLTTREISDAIRQCIAHCENIGATSPISLRECLYTLDYTDVQANEVIRYAAHRGFTHCNDPIIGERHDSFAYVWTAEQLQSRLECVL